MQGLLGVSQEDILSDYMMTLKAVNIDEILEPAAEMFSKRYGRHIDPKALWPMFGVFPEYLESALENIGDMESYAVKTLGVSTKELESFRDKYLQN